MITGYEAFGLFQSLKLHFTTDSYDFFKYNGKSRISIDAFENKKDKYYYYKLSRRLQSKNDLIAFIVANLLKKDNLWIGDLLTEESETIYRQRQKVLQSLTYTFQNDCTNLFDGVSNPNDILQSENGDYPVLLVRSLRQEIEFETLCIMNAVLNFIPLWSRKITDTIQWPEYKRKIVKYTPFLSFDKPKFKTLLLKNIQ
jgi:hypothetical protein